jgi:hypothetical protein
VVVKAAGVVGSGQIFGRHTPGGKLKNWKPEKLTT